MIPLIPIFNAYTQVSKSQIIVLYNPIFKIMATSLHFFQNVNENTGGFFFGQPGHFLSFWTARSFFHVILSGTFLGVAGNDHID